MTSENTSHDLCPKPPAVFVREATGLVREISPFNAFVTTLQVTGIPTGLATMLPFVPYVWPGADQALALMLVFPILVIHSITYTLLAWSMPRSGGDYVWTARILHPAIGSSMNFTFVLFGALFQGSFGAFAISYGVLALFVSIGITGNNPGLVSYSSGILTNPLWEAVFGTIFLLYVLFLLVLGVRSHLRQQLILWIAGIIGTALAIGILIGVTPAQFAVSFNRYLGSYSTYQHIIDVAQSNHFTWAPSMSATLLAMSFAWLINNGYQYSGYISGELKNVKTSMLFSTVGNNIFSTIVYALFAFLFVNAVGDNWLHSLAFVGYGLPSSYTLPVPPNPYFLASLLTDNVVIASVINLAIVVGSITLIASFDLALARIVMAMSFDRILPTKLADVNDRFHTPVYSILLVFIVNWVGMIASLYYGFVFANLNFTLMYTIALAIGGVTAAVFPYTKRTLYEKSPIAKFRIGSMPLITVMGVLTFMFMSYLAYAAGFNPVIGGPTNPLALAVLLVTFVMTGLLYFISLAYHKRAGLDVSAAFRELPPE